MDQNNAVLVIDNMDTSSGPVYKGLAIGSDEPRNLLFAANFRGSTVDVFETAFHQVRRPGAFTDKHIPGGYAPFGIPNIDGWLYVTSAKQTPKSTTAWLGLATVSWMSSIPTVTCCAG